MRAANVIIVTSGKSQYGSLDKLDQLIQSVVAIGKTPILVLGPDGDDFLRSCNEVEKCELVFDPNFAGGFFSGIKAGLFATNGASFIVPVNDDMALDDTKFRDVITFLENSVEGDGTFAEFDVVYPLVERDEMTQEAAIANSERIFLATARGTKVLKKFSASLNWEECTDLVVRALKKPDSN